MELFIAVISVIGVVTPIIAGITKALKNRKRKKYQHKILDMVYNWGSIVSEVTPDNLRYSEINQLEDNIDVALSTYTNKYGKLFVEVGSKKYLKIYSSGSTKKFKSKHFIENNPIVNFVNYRTIACIDNNKNISSGFPKVTLSSYLGILKAYKRESIKAYQQGTIILWGNKCFVNLIKFQSELIVLYKYFKYFPLMDKDQ